MKRINYIWICILLSIFTGVNHLLLSSSNNKKIPVKKVYNTLRLNSFYPVIDGKLDEPIWQKGVWGEDFIQKSPKEGEEPSQKTAFKFFYNNKNIYIGIRAYDDEPKKIVKRLSRRDNLDGDWIEVMLDSYFDHRTAFLFAVSAAGVKRDEFISADGDNWDDSWDPVWYVKTSINREGWTAEIRIPLTQLRFGRKDHHTWGLNVTRFIYREQEKSEWQPISRMANGYVSFFGELKGLTKIKPRRLLEIMPYSVGKLEYFEKEDGNPFATGKISNITAGLDGKIGLTNDLTMDFTINPDFGQVEADPSEVNLTAFETFFQEKRPFFIEGRNIFNFNISGGDGSFSWDNLFYSRRIGRIPQHEPDIPDDYNMESPHNTTILGAFKLTGKTRTGWSLGIMESITAKETAQIEFNGTMQKETVEPLTNYLVLRLQKDINQGKTGIGGMFTAVHRDLDLERNPHLNFLHRAAYTGGLDFFHHWKNKEWWLSANTVFSHVKGSKEAILESQESSLRYYQRPDADYVTLDPQRTSLSGYGGDISFGKTGGSKFRFATGITWRSPGLELNDVGYLRNADAIMEYIWLGYQIVKPFWILNNLYLNLNQYGSWNYGDALWQGGNFNFNLEFKNKWGMYGGIEVLGNQLSDGALRGGPSLLYPGGINQWSGFNTDPRRKIYIWVDIDNAWRQHNNMRAKHLSVGLLYKPFPALSFSLEPSYNQVKQNLQYVDTIELDKDNRYILAKLHQKTLDVTIRLNFSVTPDLSIQFYGQPFISSGKYNRFKTIFHPRADNYYDRFYLYNEDEMTSEGDYYYVAEKNGEQFQFENPAFKFLQFRSNLVVRWEYLPGSVIYVVWSQGRTETLETDVDFTAANGLRDLFHVHPHDVFLVKFTYRLKI